MKSKSILVYDLKERFIWFDGMITPKIAKKIIKIFKKLNKKSLSQLSPICFYVKGIGGDFNSTVEILRCVEGSPDPVYVIAHDYVGSGCFLLTQVGHYRLAMAGTKFRFHPASVGIDPDIKFIEQREMFRLLDRCKITNAVQLGWFLRKGTPAEEICRLFRDEAVLSLPRAKKLKLIDDYYKEEDFYKDRKIAKRLIKKG